MTVIWHIRIEKYEKFEPKTGAKEILQWPYNPG